MNRNKRVAVLTLLNREMFERGSWCGETHVQKATYLLQKMLAVDLGLDFILYRHGPFSFDLRDELSMMQANDLVSLQVREPGYGPSFVPTPFSKDFLQRFPKTVSRYCAQVEFIADELSHMNVSELERIATAFYIIKTSQYDRPVGERAEELVKLKPHITPAEALTASREVDHLIEKAAPLKLEDVSASG